MPPSATVKFNTFNCKTLFLIMKRSNSILLTDILYVIPKKKVSPPSLRRIPGPKNSSDSVSLAKRWKTCLKWRFQESGCESGLSMESWISPRIFWATISIRLEIGQRIMFGKQMTRMKLGEPYYERFFHEVNAVGECAESLKRNWQTVTKSSIYMRMVPWSRYRNA